MIPATDGSPLMTILERDGALLILDSLQGMPFAGRRAGTSDAGRTAGLGVAVGIGVDDLDASYEYCRTKGCQLRSQPSDEPWDDRVFECLDPFGYLLEISQPVSDVAVNDALRATGDSGATLRRDPSSRFVGLCRTPDSAIGVAVRESAARVPPAQVDTAAGRRRRSVVPSSRRSRTRQVVASGRGSRTWPPCDVRRSRRDWRSVRQHPCTCSTRSTSRWRSSVRVSRTWAVTTGRPRRHVRSGTCASWWLT